MLIILVLTLMFGYDDTSGKLTELKSLLKPQELPSLNDVYTLTKTVTDACRTTMVETEAARCGVLEFHNGQHSITGYSWLRMTMTYEVTAAGVTSERDNWHNIPLRDMVAWLPKLSKGECIASEDLAGDQFTSTLLTKQGMTAFFACPLKETGGHVGILLISYGTNWPVMQTNIALQKVKRGAAKIAEALPDKIRRN
jgi:hypothetical protein